MTCTSYCEKIEKVFDTMIRLAPEVLPENSRGVNNYIAAAWSEVMMLVQSIEREQGTEELRSRFESHVAAEEEKLRRNFEGVKYRIDTPDTFRVVAGKGRVERVIEAVCTTVLGSILTQPHLDPFPNVVPRFEARFGKGRSRSKPRPF